MPTTLSLHNPWFRRFLIVLFIGSILLELCQLTWWREEPTKLISPLIWLAAGSLTTVLGWLLAVYTSQQGLIAATESRSTRPWKSVFKWIVFLAGLLIGVKILYGLYQEIPEINNFSDILPAKREYVRRFLSGEVVYKPIPFEYYDLQPTFLPLRWLPFVLAQLSGLDYRWISFAGLAVGLAVWYAGLSLKTNSAIDFVLKAILPFYCLQLFVKTDNIAIGTAVELLIAGYYLIFARYLFSKNPVVTALVLTICLLSRYSLLLWLPVLFLVYWNVFRWKYLARVWGYVLLGVLLIYILPFCSHDYGKHFLDASQHYLNASFGTWSKEVWLPEGSLPFHHSRGIGFSLWFLLKAPGDLRQKFNLMLQVALVLQLVTTLALCVFYWYRVKGKNQFEVYVFLLAGLKLFMLVFNGFLVAPFSYLFEVSFYLSFPLLFILPVGTLWRGKQISAQV